MTSKKSKERLKSNCRVESNTNVLLMVKGLLSWPWPCLCTKFMRMYKKYGVEHMPKTTQTSKATMRLTELLISSLTMAICAEGVLWTDVGDRSRPLDPIVMIMWRLSRALLRIQS